MLLKELMEMSDESFSTVKMIFRSNFERRGLSISFPEHANDRATQGERGADVEDQRVMEALSRILRLYDTKDARLMGVFEVIRRRNKGVQVIFVYSYDDTAINIPCAVEPSRGRNSKFKLVVKTIMTKSNFKPHSNHDIVITL